MSILVDYYETVDPSGNACRIKRIADSALQSRPTALPHRSVSEATQVSSQRGVKALRPDQLQTFYEEAAQSGNVRPAEGNESSVSRRSLTAPGISTQTEFMAHPYWREWASLSPAVQTACRNDFRAFLVVREAGMLPGIIDKVANDLERSAVAERRDRQTRAFEQEVEDANDPACRARILERRNAAQSAFQRQIAEARQMTRSVTSR